MLINVMGLALSMACVILIFSLIKYHLGFDNFHPSSDRVYRIVTEQHRDIVSYVSSVPNPLGKALRTDHNFHDKIARIVTFDGLQVTIEQGNEKKKFKEKEGVAFAESEFFDIFNYPLLQGNKQTALTEPNSVILTERLAKKYFGTLDVINKIIRIDNRMDLKITGLLKDLPQNTDRKTEIYASFITVKDFNEWYYADDSWGGISSSMQCFIRLKEGVSVASVENVFPAYVKKYRPTSKNVHHYKLQPLDDIHFNAQYGGAMNKRNLWVLGFIGLFLIITACVNFINLATAQALKRAKEIGVRKVVGGVRAQIFWQFISETGLIALFAACIAIGLSILTLPVMNNWFKSQVELDFITDWKLSSFLLLLVMIVTFFAGSYPGLILAGFKPILAIKGKISQQSIGGFNTRRALIITQFAISQVLLIGMIVIASQMRYAKQSDLGFNKDAVVMIPVGPEAKIASMNTVKDQLSKVPGVENVSLCFSPPSSDQSWRNTFRYDNRSEDEIFPLSIKSADDKYVSTFGLKLAAGRNIIPSDSLREFLVNETFVKKLNLTSPDQVIGKILGINGGTQNAPIVGVVKDFHDRSFHEDINAVCLAALSNNYQSYAVKINLNNVKSSLSGLEKTWLKMHPDLVYEYEFLDESIAEFYETEELMLKLIQLFSLIAIFIGCLGLYGLVSFMASQKTKEIGIRKLLGGSISHILWIFGKEFSRLILIAVVIAGPVAWWLMSEWLQDFKYRIPINPLFFVFTILVTAVIAFIAGGYQAVSAALAKPVKSLKSE